MIINQRLQGSFVICVSSRWLQTNFPCYITNKERRLVEKRAHEQEARSPSPREEKGVGHSAAAPSLVKTHKQQGTLNKWRW